MVLVNSFTHELRPKVKKTYHCELNTNQATFSIATHLNLRYFPTIVSGSSVIDGNGLSIVVKLCQSLDLCRKCSDSCRKFSENQLSKRVLT